MKKFSPLIISVLAFFFWIALLEFTATYWIRRWGDPLDKAKEVLAADPKLGWCQRPHFRGNFLDIPLETNELGFRDISMAQISKAPRKVLVLGPSSTFGWGVKERETYCSVLQELLRKKFPDVPVEVINAGEIGFSSWQGLNLYKKENLKNLKADILIIAYGVNDIDRYRFFYNSRLPDKEEFAGTKPNWSAALSNGINDWNFLNAASRLIFKALSKISCASREMPQRRVSDSEFLSNMEELIDMGKANHSRVIVLSTPMSLPRFEDVADDLQTDSRKYFLEGIKKFNARDYREAVRQFERSIVIDPDQNEIYYYLSVCYSFLGNCAKSRESRERAIASEPKRIAEDILRLNHLLFDLSQRKNVTFIEMPQKPFLSQLDEDFVDPIHLSAQGNAKVGRLLYGAITGDKTTTE